MLKYTNKIILKQSSRTGEKKKTETINTKTMIGHLLLESEGVWYQQYSFFSWKGVSTF